MNYDNENKQDQKSTEDIEFDRTNVSTTETQPLTDHEVLSESVATDHSKQEELSTHDFSPLSEAEKQPKIQDKEKI